MRGLNSLNEIIISNFIIINILKKKKRSRSHEKLLQLEVEGFMKCQFSNSKIIKKKKLKKKKFPS